MSDVENVDPVESVEPTESEEANEIMNNEGPVEAESTSEVTVEPAEEEEPAPEEPAPEEPAEEEPAPEEPAPAEPAEPVSTQEVVQNVQEILSSTETNVSGNDLENRVKVLEERLERLVQVLKESWICDKINNKGSKSELYNTLIL